MEHTLRLRKGAWTSDEDDRLRTCIGTYGEGQWHRVPLRAGLNRCRRSCRLRWLNYLKPNIKRGGFAVDEIDLIIRMHKLLGNRWSLIAGRLPGRTANDVKNYWNTHLKKKYYQSSKKEIATPETTRNKIFKPRPWVFSNKFFFGPDQKNCVSNIPNTSLQTATDKLSESSSLWWQNLIAYNGDIENEKGKKQGRNNGEFIGEEMELPNEASNGVNELNSYGEDKSLWSEFCLDNLDFWDLLDAPHDHEDQLSFST